MHIMPDSSAAACDHAAAVQLVRSALCRVLGRVGIKAEGSVEGWLRVAPRGEQAAWDIPVDYPGTFALVHLAQHARPPGRHMHEQCAAELAGRLAGLAEQSRASIQRAAVGPCPAWRLDLAPPQWHLQEGCARALRHAIRASGENAHVAVVDWEEADRAAYCAACCMLARVWPQMLAEMAVLVRQLCLLDGDGLAAFSDFASHGAVYVNRRRLGPGSTGLSTGVRLAETLIHEAAHHRCNAAALTRPFLRGGAERPLVHTPLRPDPRPLGGLFQQLVVLVRSELFYRRVAEHAHPQELAVQRRRQRLNSQARQALATMREHRRALTEHGQDVVAHAEELLLGTSADGWAQ
jgi:HEXXH motif-containing protein